jgi:hypothetical protein
MHRHDRAGGRRDRGFDLFRIEVECAGSMSANTGRQAVPQQRMAGGDEGVGRGDDLAIDAERLQRRHQRQRAVGEQRDVLDAQVLAQRLLERWWNWPPLVRYLLSQICSSEATKSCSGGMAGWVT